jgi:hypothetical protein
MKKQNKLIRVVQIMWLFIAAVCAVEASILFLEDKSEQNTAFLFAGVGAFAIFRFVTLRRQQLKKEQKM